MNIKNLIREVNDYNRQIEVVLLNGNHNVVDQDGKAKEHNTGKEIAEASDIFGFGSYVTERERKELRQINNNYEKTYSVYYYDYKISNKLRFTSKTSELDAL